MKIKVMNAVGKIEEVDKDEIMSFDEYLNSEEYKRQQRENQSALMNIMTNQFGLRNDGTVALLDYSYNK